MLRPLSEPGSCPSLGTAPHPDHLPRCPSRLQGLAQGRCSANINNRLMTGALETRPPARCLATASLARARHRGTFTPAALVFPGVGRDGGAGGPCWVLTHKAPTPQAWPGMVESWGPEPGAHQRHGIRPLGGTWEWEVGRRRSWVLPPAGSPACGAAGTLRAEAGRGLVLRLKASPRPRPAGVSASAQRLSGPRSRQHRGAGASQLGPPALGRGCKPGGATGVGARVRASRGCRHRGAGARQPGPSAAACSQGAARLHAMRPLGDVRPPSAPSPPCFLFTISR